MIQAKIKSVPRDINPNPGHVLLLLWLWEDRERERLFTELIESSSYTFQFDTFTKTVNAAAERCLMEFNELFNNSDDSMGVLDIQDITQIKDDGVN